MKDNYTINLLKSHTLMAACLGIDPEIKTAEQMIGYLERAGYQVSVINDSPLYIGTVIVNEHRNPVVLSCVKSKTRRQALQHCITAMLKHQLKKQKI